MIGTPKLPIKTKIFPKKSMFSLCLDEAGVKVDGYFTVILKIVYAYRIRNFGLLLCSPLMALKKIELQPIQARCRRTSMTKSCLQVLQISSTSCISASPRRIASCIGLAQNLG
jgi:hypothetical protein